MLKKAVNKVIDDVKIVQDFNKNGFVVIPDFLTSDQVDTILGECSNIVNGLDLDQHRSIFKTGVDQGGDDYFLASSDKISYFFEEKAFDDQGNLTVPREECLNKMGHALHWLNPVFKRITFSERIKGLVKAIGFEEPVVAQSMVIFKNPRIGGKVVPHQDATFLYTKPEIKLLGLWIALSDVTLENGCLWFIPGSHRDPVSRRFVRVSDEDKTTAPLTFTAPETVYDESKFVPVTVSRGSCVLIHGLVVHKSEVNSSPLARPVYTFHIVDQKGTQWSADNWLQPSSTLPFPSLYDN